MANGMSVDLFEYFVNNILTYVRFAGKIKLIKAIDIKQIVVLIICSSPASVQISKLLCASNKQIQVSQE